MLIALYASTARFTVGSSSPRRTRRSRLSTDEKYRLGFEPSVPYELDVLVHNVGAGAAEDLSIASAQPKIVDNEKGLLINFQIVGTSEVIVDPDMRAVPNRNLSQILGSPPPFAVTS